MTVAISVDAQGNLYRLNPITASHFALFKLTTHHRRVVVEYIQTVPNHRAVSDSSSQIKQCQCDVQDQENVAHISAHYMLLETLSSCDYLLAYTFCPTLTKALLAAHIEVFKVPPIIRHIDNALSNFILSIQPTTTFNDIYNAS